MIETVLALGYLFTHLVERAEDEGIQQLEAQAAIETFGMRLLCRFTRGIGCHRGSALTDDLADDACVSQATSCVVLETGSGCALAQRQGTGSEDVVGDAEGVHREVGEGRG